MAGQFHALFLAHVGARQLTNERMTQAMERERTHIAGRAFAAFPHVAVVECGRRPSTGPELLRQIR